jgi:hypothetical protein
MKFKVEIDSRSFHMEHPRNVSAALRRLATEIDQKYPAFHNVKTETVQGEVRANDGSVVGRWEITEELP